MTTPDTEETTMQAARSQRGSPLEAALATKAAGRLRAAAYWAFTGIVAFEMAAGAVWDLLRIEFVRGAFARLGYPEYMLLVLGVWKLPCAAALLAPRFPRLKEWAYAGAFFLYTGAAASHRLAGEGADKWAGPAVFGLFTLASYALHPVDRKLPSPAGAAPPRPAAWIATAFSLVGFVVLALLTLPKGPPPP
jgi:DoxX-like family